MKRKALFIIISIGLFFGVNCKKEPPIVPPDTPKQEITLTLQDTTCTEAWLQLTFKNFTVPHNYKIYRDSTLAFTGTLFANDTTLIDTTLLPQRSYNYKALRLENNIAKDSATKVITTMDTTSHEFVFLIDTIGINVLGINSVLLDVEIVNENNIWVVGLINLNEKDSMGYSIRYNAARWDGMKWNLIAIPVKMWGTTATSTSRLETIIFFSENEIYVSGSGQIIRFNGQTWGEQSFLFTDLTDTTFGGVNKLWGTSPNDFWGVADNGNIFHFNKTSWTRIRVSPIMDLRDITGTSDGNMIIATGANHDKFGTGLFRYSNGQWKLAYDGSVNEIKLLQDTISGRIYSVFNDRDKYFYAMTWNGLYRSSYNTKGEGKRLWKSGDPYRRYVEKARGKKNDLLIVGDAGIVHYNGYSWKVFEQFQFRNSGYIFYSLDYKNNLGVAVGLIYDFANDKAVIVRMKRH